MISLIVLRKFPFQKKVSLLELPIKATDISVTLFFGWGNFRKYLCHGFPNNQIKLKLVKLSTKHSKYLNFNQ